MSIINFRMLGNHLRITKREAEALCKRVMISILEMDATLRPGGLINSAVMPSGGVRAHRWVIVLFSTSALSA
jgi:hypothetical protein